MSVTESVLPIGSPSRPWRFRFARVRNALNALLAPAEALEEAPSSRPSPWLALSERAGAPLERSARARTILAIGAHPDDVEIGCGGTLSSHVARGDRVVVLTMSSGEQAGDPSRRAHESRTVATRLGAELVLERLKDSRISEGPRTIQAIERVVQRIAPDEVYVHTESDRHQDHRAVHRATLVAARHVPSLYCYQSPSTTTAFTPTRFVDIGSHIDEKLHLISMYDSQARSKAYLAPQLVEATARYWGRFTSTEHVEPFEVLRELSTLR